MDLVALFKEAEQARLDGLPAKAMPLLQKGLWALNDAGQRRSALASAYLNALGLIAHEAGNGADAVRAFTESLEIVEELEGDTSIDWAITADNLATVFYALNRTEEALALRRTVLARLKACLPDAIDHFLITSANMCRILSDLKDYAGALAIVQDAGQACASHGRSVSQPIALEQARLLRLTEDLVGAELALAALPADNFEVLYETGLLELAKGDAAAAAELWDRIVGDVLERTRQDAAYWFCDHDGSVDLIRWVQELVWLTIQTPSPSPDRIERAFFRVVNVTGIGLDVLRRRLTLLRSHPDPDIAEAFDAERELALRLYRRLLRGPWTQDFEEFTTWVTQDQHARGAAAEEIGFLLDGAPIWPAPRSLDDVRGRLPKDSLIVWFAYARPLLDWDRSPGEPVLVRFTLSPGQGADGLTMTQVGPMAELQALCLKVHARIRESGGTAMPSTAKRVFEDIIADSHQESAAQSGHRPTEDSDALVLSRMLLPTEAFSEDIHRLLILADDVLSLVPFAALPLPDGDTPCSMWIDRFDLSILHGIQDLFRMTGEEAQKEAQKEGQEEGQGGEPLVLGGPRFSLEADENGMFKPLPAAEREAVAIADLLGVPAHIGAGASPGHLAGIGRSPSILHLATHGCYWSEALPPGKPPAETDVAMMPEPIPEWGPQGQERVLHQASGEARPPQDWLSKERPGFALLRSGLALAGANDWLEFNFRAIREAHETEANAILSAAECAWLDLSSTRLAVLSACVSGLGDIEPGAGVFGLTRGIMIAGAQGVVSTLWAIDDNATADLMVRFYTCLQEGMDADRALSRVQREARKTLAPAYWAAFRYMGAIDNHIALPASTREQSRLPDSSNKEATP